MNKDIENLKGLVEDLEDADKGAMINLSQEEIESLKNIYNLIEKQQKELELYEPLYTITFKDTKSAEEYLRIQRKYMYNGYICKDKIREILILYDNAHNELVDLPNGETMCCSDCAELIDYLRELLEENQ